MNIDPHSREDAAWQALLARSTPTFTGETTPPYGFVTSTLARLKSEKEREVLERIGLRALFASFSILVAAAVLTVGLQIHDRLDVEPGVNSIFQADDVPIV